MRRIIGFVLIGGVVLFGAGTWYLTPTVAQSESKPVVQEVVLRQDLRRSQDLEAESQRIWNDVTDVYLSTVRVDSPVPDFIAAQKIRDIYKQTERLYPEIFQYLPVVDPMAKGSNNAISEALFKAKADFGKQTLFILETLQK